MRRTHGGRLTPGNDEEYIVFQLTATLTALSSAAATRMVWGGSSYITTGGDSLTVYDQLGFSGASGDKGLARWSTDSTRFIIEAMPC